MEALLRFGLVVLDGTEGTLCDIFCLGMAAEGKEIPVFSTKKRQKLRETKLENVGQRCSSEEKEIAIDLEARKRCRAIAVMGTLKSVLVRQNAKPEKDRTRTNPKTEVR